MNDKEKAAAAALLDKLASADPAQVVQLATAYQALTQGVLNRVNAEEPDDDAPTATSTQPAA